MREEILSASCIGGCDWGDGAHGLFRVVEFVNRFTKRPVGSWIKRIAAWKRSPAAALTT
jgi:hypothetical protein